MKTLKVILWMAIILLFIAVGVVLVFTTVYDPNVLKPQIVKKVEQHIGRKLVMDGDLSFTYYPWLGIESGRIALSNPDGFEKSPMIAADQIKIRVKLLPLLKKQVEVGKILIDRPKIDFIVRDDGVNNWDDLVSPSGKKASAGDGNDTGESDAVAMLTMLAVEGVQIKNGGLSYVDQANDQSLQISDMQFKTGELRLGESTDLDMAMNLEGGGLTKTTIKLLTGLSIDEQFKTIDLSETNIEVDKGEVITLESKQITYDLAADTLVSPLVKVQQLDAEAILSKINAQDIRKSAKVSGSVKMDSFNLAQLLKTNQIEIGLPDGLAESFAADFTYSYSPAGIKIGGLKASIDNRSLQGDFDISNWTAPRYGFELKLDKLDLDRLYPSGEKSKTNSNETGAASGPTPLPLEPFRKLDMDGNLVIGELKSSGLLVRDVEVKVKAQNGRVRLEPVVMSFADGKINAAIDYQVMPNGARIGVNTDLTSVDVGSLLSDMAFTDRLEGVGNLVVKLGAHGKDFDALISSLGGNIHLSMADGAIKGFDLQQMIINTKALAGSSAKDDSTDTGIDRKTRFAELAGDFIADQGVLRTSNLSMKAPALRFLGHGDVNLVTKSMDFKLDVNVVDTIMGQGGKSLENLKGVKIPFSIDGSLSSPRYRLNMAALLKERLKREALKKLTGDVPDEGAAQGVNQGEGQEGQTSEQLTLKQKAEKKLKKELGIEDDAQDTSDPKKSLEQELKEKAKKSLLKGLFD